VSSKWSPSFRLPFYNPVYISHLTHTCPMPHAPPVPSSLMWSNSQYLVRTPYARFSSLLILLSSQGLITLFYNVLGLCCSLKWHTKFFTHVPQQAELEFCIFYVSKNEESPGSSSFTETPHPFCMTHLQLRKISIHVTSPK
jgi:hypothetical protein